MAVEVEEEAEEEVAATGMAAEKDSTEEVEEVQEDTVQTSTRTVKEEKRDRQTVILHT